MMEVISQQYEFQPIGMPFKKVEPMPPRVHREGPSMGDKGLRPSSFDVPLPNFKEHDWDDYGKHVMMTRDPEGFKRQQRLEEHIQGQLDILREVLGRHLTSNLQANPDRYWYDEKDIPVVVERFIKAFQTGQFHFSESVKAMCKELGIKPTPKGIAEFIFSQGFDREAQVKEKYILLLSVADDDLGRQFGGQLPYYVRNYPDRKTLRGTLSSYYSDSKPFQSPEQAERWLQRNAKNFDFQVLGYQVVAVSSMDDWMNSRSPGMFMERDYPFEWQKTSQVESDPLTGAIREVIARHNEELLEFYSQTYSPDQVDQLRQILFPVRQKIVDAIEAILFTEGMLPGVTEDDIFLEDGSINTDVVEQAYRKFQSLNASPGVQQSMNPISRN